MTWKPKIAPEKVFTPRAAEINDRMYVRRTTLEDRLRTAMRSTKYVVIHGESGNGKTWLYKKVFQEEGIDFFVINLATAANLGGLAFAFESRLGEMGFEPAPDKQTQISSGVRPAGIGMDVVQTTTAKQFTVSPLLTFVQAVRKHAGARRAAIILDNFEQAVDNPNIMKEIAGVIISADDDSVSKSDVKFIIVGVPGDIRSMISKIGNAMTISNRLTEIPEVARMSGDEASDLMKRGLEDELGLSVSIDSKTLYGDLCWKTDRIAQHIHELCLNIANESIANNGIIDESVVISAEKNWLDESLSSDWAVIEALMNSRETKVGRKNQVIYALGKCDQEDFRYTDIDKIIRSEFPKGAAGVSLNVAGTLTSFSASDNPIIRRTPKNDAYRFVSPKLRMAIRTRLTKNDQEQVVKAF